jgi:cytochrome c biogenesis protein CcdA|tara:strand:- start:1204 stop:1863 length:660 start_codon:yes stop_codon:yes gene_type:complete
MVDIVSIMYPFTAGIFVLLSPCGYALIPGYISYHLGSEVSFSRALQGGVISTMGLVTVFSILGIMSSFISGLIMPYLTLLTVFSGIVVMILGGLILGGFSFPSFLRFSGSSRRGMMGFFVFGIAYGLGAAGCTAPVFFSIILIGMLDGGVFGGLLTFVLYALGVGIPLIITSILVATAKRPLLLKINNITPRLYKFSGVVLILVGIYLIYTYMASGLVA